MYFIKTNYVLFLNLLNKYTLNIFNFSRLHIQYFIYIMSIIIIIKLFLFLNNHILYRLNVTFSIKYIL